MTHLRTWTQDLSDGYTGRLDLWDTGRTRDGKSELRYALALIPSPATDLTRSLVMIEGEDFWPSPLHAIDSDETAAGLLGFFAFDGECFALGTDDETRLGSYTPEQRELLAALSDPLCIWGIELEGDA